MTGFCWLTNVKIASQPKIEKKAGWLGWSAARATGVLELALAGKGEGSSPALLSVQRIKPIYPKVD